MGEIARIHRAGIELELAQIGHQLDPKYSLYWFEQVWDIQDCEIKTYEIDGKTVGFITVVAGEIMIYVDPDHHRKGIGSELINQLSGMVWVLKGNKPAEEFYKKNGFYNTGEIKNMVMFGHEAVAYLWERGEYAS